MSKELTAFTDIKELYSFASLSKKAGRKPLDEDLKPQKKRLHGRWPR